MKRTFSALLVFVLAFIMCFSVCAVTLDVAENAADVTVVSEAELAEDTAPTYKPGLNIYTGTTAPFDFEGADASIKTTVVGDTGSYEERDLNLITISNADFVVKATADNENNTAMRLAGSYPHFGFQMSVLPVIEAERPVQVSFKYISDGSTKLRFIRNTINMTSPSLGGPDMTSTSDTWVKYSTKIVGTSSAVTNNAKPASYCKDDTQDIKTLIFMKPAGDTVNIYIDDLSVVPFYKISYVGLDGETVVFEDYALLNSNGDRMDYYTPDISKVSGATGYALTKGGERVAEIPLSGTEDIKIYAIDTPVVGLAYGDTYKNVTVEGDTYTFPVASETFEGIKNFFVYSDGTSFYKEGDKVAAADVIGKTFTAICTTYKAFDASLGELAILVDYELIGVDAVPGTSVGSGAVLPSYKNSALITSAISHSDGNGIATADVADDNGNRVLKFNLKAAEHSHWVLNFTAPELGKYTIMEKAKAEATGDLSKIFAKTWTRIISGGNNQGEVSNKPTANWVSNTRSLTVKAAVTGTSFNYPRADKTVTPKLYKDDYVLYIYRAAGVYFIPEFGSQDFTINECATTKYTFPKPEDLGYKADDFYAWTNGNVYYKAGAEVDLANVLYKAFYPAYQTAEQPAMGFTFEGERKASGAEVGNPKYTKNIIDDGRDVLHVHYWNGKSGEGKSFASDTRLTFKTSTYSNPAEYNILQYSLRIGKMWNVVGGIKNPTRDEKGNALYVPSTTESITVHAHTAANGTYTNPVITCISQTVSVSDNEYTLIEKDMSTNSTFFTKAGYGFCIEPCKATYGYDVYMDYFRVYRKGLQTITYATNAPVGATVVKEVAADTNRGLGYGYLLKDVRPEVEGYVFLGWGLTPDATETVNSITVDGNETVYAVWAEADTVDTPEVTDEVEIRGNGENNGIRFKSAIKPSVKANLDEFGFLATREVLLPYTDEEKTTRNYNYLTFNHKVNGADANYYVQGIAYDADGGIDKENGNNTDGSTVYTAVLSGIPMENKNEKMVVRSYAKYTVNGKEMVVYGNTNAASLYETAAAIKEAGGTAYTNNKAYIDEIVG